MRGSKTLFKSARTDETSKDDWRTPLHVVDCVRAAFEGTIDLDPCADADPANWIAERNLAGPKSDGGDGLLAAWHGRVFVNPPYSTLRAWMDKLVDEWQRWPPTITEAIVLCPSRTETRAWKTITAHASAVCFIHRRLNFVGGEHSATFPSALIYLGDRPGFFAKACLPLGPSWKPLRVGAA